MKGEMEMKLVKFLVAFFTAWEIFFRAIFSKQVWLTEEQLDNMMAIAYNGRQTDKMGEVMQYRLSLNGRVNPFRYMFAMYYGPGYNFLCWLERKLESVVLEHKGVENYPETGYADFVNSILPDEERFDCWRCCDVGCLNCAPELFIEKEILDEAKSYRVDRDEDYF